MKFLGIRNGHDCNLTYTDGTAVRYIKFERNLQQKHYNWGHTNGDDYKFLLETAQNILNVSFKDVKAVAISNDAAHHKLDRDLYPHELAIQIEKGRDSLFDQFTCPVYQLDHHYTHALANWPLVDTESIRTHFVFDGLGDHGRVSSIFTATPTPINNRYTLELVDYIDRTENLGLSVTMERIGQRYGMQGMVLDMSGKLMALKAFHKLPDELIAYIMQWATPMNYRQLQQFIAHAEAAQAQYDTHAGNEKQRMVDLAHLLHVFGEQKLPKYFSRFANTTERISYSGGTAQNTVVNSRLRERFPNIVIPPHCPDDGLSLGCVEFLRILFRQPQFDRRHFPFWQSDTAPASRPSASTIDKTAEMLAQGKIVGWYQGHGEIGPRALGNRSILMDPSIKGGKDLINNKVKHREPYRPFGASILEERTSEFFHCDFPSPYMLYVIESKDPTTFASIVHVDGTCRIQTVDASDAYADYRQLIQSFESKTGIPMLLNTSLNVDGKPIAASPEDAVTLLQHSEMDAVVIGDQIIAKSK